jgi:hypothetical protein
VRGFKILPLIASSFLWYITVDRYNIIFAQKKAHITNYITAQQYNAADNSPTKKSVE